jgi:hypothetical protein
MKHNNSSLSHSIPQSPRSIIKLTICRQNDARLPKPGPTQQLHRSTTGKERKPKKPTTSNENAESQAELPDEQLAANTASTPLNVTDLTITHADVKKPIQCHQYTPKPTSSDTPPTLIFTHGAGGTLSADAVVNLCTGSSSSMSVLAFQDSMNLKARTKSFHACTEELRSKDENSMKRRGRRKVECAARTWFVPASGPERCQGSDTVGFA